MAKIDTEVKEVFGDWLDFLIPKSLTPKELKNLAKKAKLSTEALRKLRSRERQGMSTDTFIRLALSRGMTPNALVSSLLKPNRKSKLDQTEIDWIKYGAGLEPKKRKEFLDFIKYLRKTWDI